MTDNKPPTLDDKYQLLNRLINAALFAFHPDHYRGGDPETSRRMTRGLIAAKRKFRETYQRLKGKP
jgi:hypothetical protein